MFYTTNSPNISGIVAPHIIDKSSGTERIWDLWSRLHSDRIVFLGEQINDYNANVIIGQLLQLESTDRSQPIQMYINSPGGGVSAGLAIYDIMQYISPEVRTICVGQASSMAAVLLACGAKGHRYCMSNASVMIHQPHGGTHGQITDMEISLNRAKKLKEKLNRILSDVTGQDYEKICSDAERDYWLDAGEAKEYGLIDKVFTNRVEEEDEDTEKSEG